MSLKLEVADKVLIDVTIAGYKFCLLVSLSGPFKNYPQITVYHPNEGHGHSFINIGWSGWVGSITGI